jgi:hypothetical protein
MKVGPRKGVRTKKGARTNFVHSMDIIIIIIGGGKSGRGGRHQGLNPICQVVVP